MKKQEGSLNLLKLLATIIIVLHHFQYITGTVFEGHINFYKGSFYWGNLVELFFILSGYFTYRYAQSSDLSEGFFSFFRKKYLRFLPMLVITGVSTALILYWHARINKINFSFTLWSCLGGILGFGRLFSTSTIVNAPTWYVDVLLGCYAVFYLVTFIAKRLKISTSSAYLVTMLFGIMMYHICHTYSFSMPFFSYQIGRGLICFFFGLIFRALLEQYPVHRKPSVLLLCAIYLCGFIFLYRKKNGFVADNLYYLLVFTVFPCVIILFKAEFLQKLCSGKFFTSLSSITYHTYMWHLSVLYLVIIVYHITNTPIKTIFAMYVTLALSFAVGILSSHLNTLITQAVRKRKALQNT